MSACPDCPRYGNPSYQGPRQATCCMEKAREPDLKSQMASLKDELRAPELEASRNPNNRHSRRRLAKMNRLGEMHGTRNI